MNINRNDNFRCTSRTVRNDDMIRVYLFTEIGQPSGGSSTVHIYTQTVHRTTQNKQYVDQHKNVWKSACRAPNLQVLPRKKHGKTSVKVAEECQLAR
jgi:hypothetical protein